MVLSRRNKSIMSGGYKESSVLLRYYESFLFFARFLPAPSFFLPAFCPWLPPKNNTNKKIRADLPAGKKNDSVIIIVSHKSIC